MPYLKSLAAAIAWTWLCLLPTSCLDLGSEDEEKDGQKDVLFRNASSYTVTVMPGPDDRFQRFSLPPGASNLVVKEDITGRLEYGFGPGDRVYIEHVSATEIVFRTR